MRDRWRVAILDSGLADPVVVPDSHLVPVASCRFVDTGDEILEVPTIGDAVGHGTEVSRVICGAERSVDLIVGQVLDQRGVTTAAALAAAIVWSVEEGADLIHMSLGLRADRPILAAAVAMAIESGCIVVASAPARGESTFPARYPQVIRATGDARCQPDEISALDSAQADFGGCPRRLRGGASTESDPVRAGGASLGAAHLTQFLVQQIAVGSAVGAICTQLRALARYQGIETRAARSR